jgi:putative transposase
MMEERGVEVDHSSIYRWVQKFTPKLEAVFRKSKKHSVDKEGQTVAFLLTITSRLLCAIRQQGLPDKVTIDKNGTNTSAIEALQEETSHMIEIRQCKYLNNLIEQDHRTIKRIIRPMLDVKSFRSARTTLQGIGLMHRIRAIPAIAIVCVLARRSAFEIMSM